MNPMKGIFLLLFNASRAGDTHLPTTRSGPGAVECVGFEEGLEGQSEGLMRDFDDHFLDSLHRVILL